MDYIGYVWDMCCASCEDRRVLAGAKVYYPGANQPYGWYGVHCWILDSMATAWLNAGSTRRSCLTTGDYFTGDECLYTIQFS